jgi:uncharacterized protein YdaU (DUF1376 family)
MSGLPWFKFYPSDWLAGTGGMSAYEIAAYITLIAIMYDQGRPVTTDRAILARKAGMSLKQFAIATASLVREGKILETPDGLWNARVREEFFKAEEKRDAAKKSAGKRWDKKTEQNQREGDANASQPHKKPDANGMLPDTRCQMPDAREDITPSRAREPLEQLEKKLRRAAGWESDPSPNLFVVGQIAGLIDAGCDLELDVLPVIRSRAPGLTGKKNWNYFVAAIQQARDQRIAAATNVSNPHQTSAHHAEPFPRKQSRHERVDAAAAAVKERLAGARRPSGHEQHSHVESGDAE